MSITPNIAAIQYYNVFGSLTILEFNNFTNVLIKGEPKSICIGNYSCENQTNQPFEWFVSNVEKSLNNDNIIIKDVIYKS